MKNFEYKREDGDKDVVVSVRVRLARNLDKTPFPGRCTAEAKRQIAEKIKNALSSDKFNFTDMTSLSKEERECFAESRNVSRDFISSPEGGMLITSKSSPNLFVMVNEEDHIRAQAIYDRMALDEAFDEIMRFDDTLEDALSKSSLSLAFDKDLGYLTSCPSNIGCGLRASVMLHLPALSMSGKIQSLGEALGKLGCNLRGSYGEGSQSAGTLYQISNRSSKGKTEKEIMESFKRICGEVIETERKERIALYKKNALSLEDKIMRAYGTMRYARRIPSKELTELYAYVRLGISLGLEELPTYEALDRLAVELMPAHLSLSDRSADDPYARDTIRADKLRAMLQ